MRAGAVHAIFAPYESDREEGKSVFYILQKQVFKSSQLGSSSSISVPKKKSTREMNSLFSENVCPAYHHFTGLVSQIRSHTVFNFRAYKHIFI